jgi:ABC-2 type transport system ATP-binding protein
VRLRIVCVLVVAALIAVVAPWRARGAAPPFKYSRGFISSFDGTPIVWNLFLPNDASPSHQVPVILRGHGWGGSGETDTSASGTLTKLVAADYAVMTWDSRGFGQSGGEANIDDPGFEVRDASALVDLLATRPEIAQNAPGDPLLGMTGGSYAGGIQLALAAFDHRVDVIAPEITWNDLRYSLFPHDVIKFGWDQLLYAAGLATAATDGITPSGTAGIQTGAYAPQIHESEVKGAALGVPDQDTLDWFKGKGVAYYGTGHPVRVPTLLMQGSVDTLFNLNDAYANFRHVQAQGAPAKLIAFCGGHVSCPSDYKDGGARDHLDSAILTWFSKYLRHKNVSTGAPVEYTTQDGVWHTAANFPTVADKGAAKLVSAKGSVSVVNTGLPTSGPGGSDSIDPVVTDAPSISGDPGTGTLPVLTATKATQVVGIGHVMGTVTGVGAGTHLFFKLVDREANRVLDLQAESLRVDGPLLNTPVKIDLNLVGVTYQLPAGHHLDLQISTGSLAHVEYRGPASVTVAATVTVPTL